MGFPTRLPLRRPHGASELNPHLCMSIVKALRQDGRAVSRRQRSSEYLRKSVASTHKHQGFPRLGRTLVLSWLRACLEEDTGSSAHTPHASGISPDSDSHAFPSQPPSMTPVSASSRYGVLLAVTESHQRCAICSVQVMGSTVYPPDGHPGTSGGPGCCED